MPRISAAAGASNAGYPVPNTEVIVPDTSQQIEGDLVVRGSIVNSTVAPAAGYTPSLALPPSPARTVISAFQTGHGWTTGGSPSASNLNDTTDFVIGSQAVSFATASGAASYIESPTIGTPINLTGKTFALLVKIDTATFDNMSYLYIYAGSGGGFTNYQKWAVRLRSQQQTNASSYLTVGEWQWIVIGKSDSSLGAGSPDLTAINKLRVISGPLASVITSLHVGAIATVPEPTSTQFPNGVVCLTFDDGYASLQTIVKPYMDQYLFPATVFPIGDLIDTTGRITTPQLLALQAQGWEIALHTDTLANHALGYTSMSVAQVKADMLAERQRLANSGITVSDGFAWPRGLMNAATISAASAQAAYGRLNDWASGMEIYPPVNPMRIRSWPVASGDSAGTLTALIDSAYTNKGMLVFTIHDVVASGATGGTQMNQATFNSLVDYCSTKGIPVRTIGQVMATR